MAAGTIEEALKITLADFRLSRGEKRALAGVIEKLAQDDHRLALARHHAFKIARKELTSPDAVAVVDWLEEVVKLLLPKDVAEEEDTSEAYFSPDDNCVGRIVRLFETSRKKVDICVFTITDDRITDAILKAHHRNVGIRIISDNKKSEDLGSDIDELNRFGVQVRVDESKFHMHHKFALFDNRQLLTGSYNWTRSAAKYNEENYIITSDTKLIKAFGHAFEKLWNQLE